MQLLGEQLIGSPKLAIFELVKNAYDADANKVTVEINGIDGEAPQITITDNGIGMSASTVEEIWLVPGDDHREIERKSQKRSTRYQRLPMGEKGVGRFAVHKLGNRIEMVSKSANNDECVVNIDWASLLKNHYLEDTRVIVETRKPEIFTDGRTGTQITISDLSKKTWERGDVREVYRQLSSIGSPFGHYDDDFEIEVIVPEHQDWISSLPSPNELLEKAPWHFTFSFENGTFTYNYSFRGVRNVKVDTRTIENAQIPLLVADTTDFDDLDPASPTQKSTRTKKVVATAETQDGIGPIEGEFYVFDLDKELLAGMGDTRYLKRYLDQNGGVRVYRDGIRVYNYGEQGDDWLGLDLRRVNSPTRNISRNIIVGAINLDLNNSDQLKEKTNREGFVENIAYTNFRQIVIGALSTLETERKLDKSKIRSASGKSLQAARDITTPISQLRAIAKKHNISNEFEPVVKRIENEYSELRDNFLRAGLSQVGLALVFHEVERGVSVLAKSIGSGIAIEDLKMQAGQLQRILETSTQLLRKSDKKVTSLRALVKRARDLSAMRFRAHGIKLYCPAAEDDGPDATAYYAPGLALGALTNLIDNAIHWLKVSHHTEASAEERRIFLNIDPDFPSGPAIIVADNGTGFMDPPENLIQPFFSRRPDGMGLGLYYSNLVMQLNEGELTFPALQDIDVPDEFDGAVVAMVFKGAK